MDPLRRGIVHLCWHEGERRLRAPLRIGATLLFAAVALLALGTAASLLGRVVGWAGPWAATVGEIVLVGVAIPLFLGISTLVDRRRLRDIGLGAAPRWAVEFGVGLALGGLMAGAVVVAVLAAGLASVDGSLLTRDGDLLAGLPLAGGVGLGFALFLLLAALEEVVFRGYLLVNVAEGLSGPVGDRTAVGASVAVTAGLFGVAHALNPEASVVSALNIALFGLLLGGGYALTGRLAIPIGVHTAWNFALGVVFGLPVSGLTTGAALVAVAPDGPPVVTGGGFGPEGGLVALGALAVGAGGLGLWVRYAAGDLDAVERIAQHDLRRSN